MADRGGRVRVRATRQISDDISDASDDSEQSSPDPEDSEGEDFDPRRADAMRRAGRQHVSFPCIRSRVPAQHDVCAIVDWTVDWKEQRQRTSTCVV